MKPMICEVCAKPGTQKWTIRHDGTTVRLHLCVVHADNVHMLFKIGLGQGHRFANPGTRPLTRAHATPRDDVEPMDWMPLPSV